MRVAFCIVLLNVLKLGSLLEGSYLPVEISQPFMYVRIPRANITDVALEMLNVDGIETNDGGIEAYIHFCEVFSKIELRCLFSKMSFDVVEGAEQALDCILIGFLCSGILLGS